ncbi:DUF2508 family protein [Cohnella faecalis]|uniref:DUF2508 family protein n=1 Tax=Cohnella faecalis TaxID=2315694 RepID=A0A398CIL7_9BACL|nr:DUF2508 family protein [Cohnella faecalis]RIE01039.1 DUF2508 family protein [Cohnella faecalis]
MRWAKKSVWTLVQSEERQQLTEDVREAEREWELARWRFEDALGHDSVDYAIYTLEAAEKKLDMLLRKAKVEWVAEVSGVKSRGKRA